MADNGSSNVASVAIVILIIAVGVGVFYFINQGGLKGSDNGSTTTSKVEVTLPKAVDTKSN